MTDFQRARELVAKHEKVEKQFKQLNVVLVKQKYEIDASDYETLGRFIYNNFPKLPE